MPAAALDYYLLVRLRLFSSVCFREIAEHHFRKWPEALRLQSVNIIALIKSLLSFELQMQ